ncbi:MAG: hypothetical protein IPJ97_13140 [Proteobacteria bacterium]|nr:hypothetical protein [Pseudomonadota bacterium]
MRFQQRRHASGPGKLRLNLSDRFSFTLAGDYSDNDGIPALNSKIIAVRPGFTLPLNTDVLSNAYRASTDYPASANLRNAGVSLNAEVKVLDDVSLQSITAYRDNRAQNTLDTDGTELRLRESAIIETQDQFTQEILANFSNSRLKAVVGLFYLEENVDTCCTVNTVLANQQLVLLPEMSTKSYSAFGNARPSISPIVCRRAPGPAM